MFPNSPNASFSLLDIKYYKDEIGVSKKQIIRESKVMGCIKSVTSFDYNSNIVKGVKLDLKVMIPTIIYKDEQYVSYKKEYYRIERTFINGNFIELYLIRVDEVDMYDRVR